MANLLETRLGELQAQIDKLTKRLATFETSSTPGNYTAGSVLFGSATGSITQDNNAFFFDDTNNRLGIGTNAPTARLTLKGTDSTYAGGPHIETYTTADNYPQLQILPYLHDNINISFDAYWDGSNWRSSDAGSNFQIRKLADLFSIFGDESITAGNVVTWVSLLSIDTAGNVESGARFISNAQGVQSLGTNAGLVFEDRTSAQAWQWFGQSSSAQLYNGTLTLLTIPTAGGFTSQVNTATTASAVGHSALQLNTSGTAANGLGPALFFNTEDDGNTIRNQGDIRAVWATAASATRKGRMQLVTYDASGGREGIRVETNGSAPMIGFLATAASAKLTVTGAKGGNAALASLLTQLATYGLITDSTT